MKLSQRAAGAKPSATLAITARAKKMKAEGLDVVNFGVGEPDFPTPEYIVDAAREAMQKKLFGYTAAGGTPELRKAVCDKLLRDNGLSYTPAEVLISNGAKHSLYNAFQAIVDPGQEVILPAPCWVSYPEMVRLAGGQPLFVDGRAENNYHVSAAEIEAAVTENTVAICINSPSNPTGLVLSLEELEAIAEVAIRHDLWVVSDEIYEKLIYGKTKHYSIASLPGMQERTIVVNGMSKAYAMTGWRIGYAAGPQAVISAMDSIQSHATAGPNSIAQYAATEALRGGADFISELHNVFEERRNLMVGLIDSIPGLSCSHPEGAFYVLVDVSGFFGKELGGALIEDCSDFAKALLEQQYVAVVPGTSFRAPDCIRLSYATDAVDIKRGIARIKAFCASR